MPGSPVVAVEDATNGLQSPPIFQHVVYGRWALLLLVVFILCGLVCGLNALAFAHALAWAEDQYRSIFLKFNWAAFLIVPFGLAATRFLVDQLAPSAGGSGIPVVQQVLYATDSLGTAEEMNVDEQLGVKT